VFRRRRRVGEDGTGRQPGDESYPAADDELAEEDLTEDEYDEDFAGDEYEAAGRPAGAEDYDEVGIQDYDGSGPDDAKGEGLRPERDDLGDPATWTRLRDSPAASPAMARSTGPWDSATDYPEGERIDFGSLLVPVRDGFDLQALISEEEGISIVVARGNSGLQLLPFAAPRSSGLWHEVLPEIAEEVAKAGGKSTEQDGPFGPELLATVSPLPDGDYPAPPQELRFMGADGPRWFLRGLISGPAATDPELARPLKEIFADVVVVRGDHAQPPRQPLEIRLPQEAQEVFNQAAAQDPDLLSPFERGPEITETR